MSDELIKIASNGQWSLEKSDVRLLRTFHFTPGGFQGKNPVYNFFRIGPDGNLPKERSGQVSLNSKTGNIYPLTPTMHPKEYDNFFGNLEEGKGVDSAKLEQEVLAHHNSVGQRTNPAPPKTDPEPKKKFGHLTVIKDE